MPTFFFLYVAVKRPFDVSLMPPVPFFLILEEEEEAEDEEVESENVVESENFVPIVLRLARFLFGILAY